ncbi:MAG: 50S ribosomal protein L10 [Bacilli bacterium]|nr:50S ribosomal protein L10 [Bacilli bacterium]MDD4406539.1 50S ribosomal protein L10 [Bacilli bacterium]
MASEKNLNLKKDIVKEILKKIDGSEAVVLFTYHGLKVSDLSNLRKNLKEINSEVKIYKNTLVKIALADKGLNLDEFLAGPNAILFGKNLLEPIKALDNFAKQNKSVEIRTGIVKGDIVSLDIIKEYASIPSMDGLLTMLASGMIEHVKNLSIGLNLYAEQLENKN